MIWEKSSPDQCQKRFGSRQPSAHSIHELPEILGATTLCSDPITQLVLRKSQEHLRSALEYRERVPKERSFANCVVLHSAIGTDQSHSTHYN